MKTKILHDKKTDTSSLTVRLTKGEELLYAQAEQLCALQGVPYLPFAYVTEKDGSIVFTYDVSDTITLGMYLGAELSREQFRLLMIDIVETVEACERNGFSYTELIFDHSFVYMDAETNHLCFAYMPATVPSNKRANIIDLLRFIATRTRFICKEDSACSEDLLDFLKRQTIFSLVDFKAFLGLQETLGARSDLNLQEPLGARSVLSSQELQGARSVLSSQEPQSTQDTQGAGGAYDFIKAQAGTLSAQETRASQNLAEQVSFDVADTATPLSHVTAPALNNTPSAALGDESKSVPSDAPIKPITPTQTQTYCIVRVSTSERYTLPPLRQTTVGRSKRCDICMMGNSNMSRVHAIFELNDAGCFITDQDTTNKTKVRGKELEPFVPERVENGDDIKLADECLRLEVR